MNGVILMFPRNDFTLDCKHVERVKAAAPGYDVMLGYDGISGDVYARTEVCFGAPSDDQLRRMASLRWLHLPIAGADAYANLSRYVNKDIIVTKSSGVFGQPIAEHALCVMLMLSRSMHLYRDQQHARVWQGYMPSTDFAGARVLILGMGDIGTQLASRSKALGAHVVCIKRTPGDKPCYVDELYCMDALDIQLPMADFVVLCLPGTAETRGIINMRQLKKMKNSAILVNVGRGSAINERDLVDAMREKVIYACALDVMEYEPLEADNPLWDVENIFITPHNSGRSPTNINRSFDIFINNLHAYVNNLCMQNLVNFAEGY